MAVPEFALAELERRRQAGLLRRMRPIDGPADRWVQMEDRRALLLCSNNYLGLATHPALIAAANAAATEFGIGAGASRLISGSTRLHHQLEGELAEFKGCERALLFSSGYQANLGAISALVGRDDEVFSDELNHASLIDGCRLARAEVSVYPHCDLDILADQLRASRAARKLIVTDSIFSMDGDRAPLAEICALAERYGAMVLVDEAHATGVVGPDGRGLVAELGLTQRVTLQMSTLGKALGTFGAFVAGPAPLIELLINAARSFVFTTALPPPVVAAARQGLAIARVEEDRRIQLRHNGTRLSRGLLDLGFDLTPPGVASLSAAPHITPVMIGDAQRTMDLSAALLDAGVFVQGIRPPTVPSGSARLRVTVMSTHTDEDIDFALAAFRSLGPPRSIIEP